MLAFTGEMNEGEMSSRRSRHIDQQVKEQMDCSPSIVHWPFSQISLFVSNRDATRCWINGTDRWLKKGEEIEKDESEGEDVLSVINGEGIWIESGHSHRWEEVSDRLSDLSRRRWMGISCLFTSIDPIDRIVGSFKVSEWAAITAGNLTAAVGVVRRMFLVLSYLWRPFDEDLPSNFDGEFVVGYFQRRRSLQFVLGGNRFRPALMKFGRNLDRESAVRRISLEKVFVCRTALLAIDWKLFPELARRAASICCSTILSKDTESNPCFSSTSEEIVARSSNQRCSGWLSHFFFAQIEKIVVVDDRAKEFFQFFAAALAESRHHAHLIVEMPSTTCKTRADKRSLLLLLLLLLGRERRNEFESTFQSCSRSLSSPSILCCQSQWNGAFTKDDHPAKQVEIHCTKVSEQVNIEQSVIFWIAVFNTFNAMRLAGGSR